MKTGSSVFRLMLFSSAIIVSGEHASPTASGKQNPGKKVPGRGLRKGSSNAERRKDMKEAVDEVLGPGHGIEQQGLEAIRRKIEPMWRVLTKNKQGGVDRRSLRYTIQRFFMQRHHMSIVGLEANLASDTQSEAAVLLKYAPNYVRKVTGDAARSGFFLEDAVAMIAALRRLVENSGSRMLEAAYISRGKDPRLDVGREEMGEIMEGYILRWMMGDDPESIALLEKNSTLREASFQDWGRVYAYARGQVAAFEYARQHTNGRSHVNTWNALRPHFSFADAQAVVGSIALSFGGFWESECAYVKDTLVSMDRSKTSGRVKLSDFHGAALKGEWRFSESKEYLRQLGALDEGSSWKGPRVIISNYVQAASNCIIAMEHFRVCCHNECEEHIDDLENSLGRSMATPEEIIPIVERMYFSYSDEIPRITSSLNSQLKQIAASHNGQVPIHGRLFSQWMHYVFPIECPFPHKSGTTTTLTPLAFGDYIASQDEMILHRSMSDKDANATGNADLEEDWMPQWSHEEELLTDLSPPSSWEADFSTSALGLMLIAGVGLLLSKSGIISMGVGKDLLPTRGKSHYV